MNKKIYLPVTLLLLVGMLFSTGCNKGPKLAYAEINTVYNAFELKKELEEKLAQTQQERQAILDTLKLRLQVMNDELSQKKPKPSDEEIQEFQLLGQEYQMKNQRFQEDNKALIEQYDQQIWNQLNQYMKEYGEKNGYDFIYGASGNGNLIHANEAANITEELSQYANKKYKGE